MRKLKFFVQKYNAWDCLMDCGLCWNRTGCVYKDGEACKELSRNYYFKAKYKETVKENSVLSHVFTVQAKDLKRLFFTFVNCVL